jgi:hypothetical protein
MVPSPFPALLHNSHPSSIITPKFHHVTRATKSKSWSWYLVIYIVTLAFGVWCQVPRSMTGPWVFPLYAIDPQLAAVLLEDVPNGLTPSPQAHAHYWYDPPYPAHTPYSAWLWHVTKTTTILLSHQNPVLPCSFQCYHLLGHEHR